MKDAVTAPLTTAVDRAKPTQPWAGAVSSAAEVQRRDKVAFGGVASGPTPPRTLNRIEELRSP